MNLIPDSVPVAFEKYAREIDQLRAERDEARRDLHGQIARTIERVKERDAALQACAAMREELGNALGDGHSLKAFAGTMLRWDAPGMEWHDEARRIMEHATNWHARIVRLLNSPAGRGYVSPEAHEKALEEWKLRVLLLEDSLAHEMGGKIDEPGIRNFLYDNGLPSTGRILDTVMEAVNVLMDERNALRRQQNEHDKQLREVAEKVRASASDVAATIETVWSQKEPKNSHPDSARQIRQLALVAYDVGHGIRALDLAPIIDEVKGRET